MLILIIASSTATVINQGCSCATFSKINTYVHRLILSLLLAWGVQAGIFTAIIVHVYNRLAHDVV